MGHDICQADDRAVSSYIQRMIRLFILLLVSSLSCAAQSLDEIKTYVRAAEGCSLVSYQLRGEWHIGVGHRLNAWHPSISTARADRYLMTDLTWAMRAAFQLVPSFETQPKSVRLMIIALVFNTGADGFARFVGFRRALGARDYRAAARELRMSLWSRQLERRASTYIAILDTLSFPS